MNAKLNTTSSALVPVAAASSGVDLQGWVNGLDHLGPSAPHALREAVKALMEEHAIQAAELANLREKVSDLEAELEPHQQADLERQATELREERLRSIIDCLFPVYNAVRCRALPAEKPPIHPGKAWWWNGARLLSEVAVKGGDLLLKVRSYVGRGETDDFEVTIPGAWMTAEDPKPLVLAWIHAETERVTEAERLSEIAAAQREILAQTERLASLTAAGRVNR